MIYQVCKAASAAMIDGVFGLQAHGAEKVPLTGSILIAANHVSYLDPPAIGSVLPRPLYYFARSSLFRGPFAWLLPRLNSVPVKVGEGSDLSSVRTALQVLSEDKGLLIFPEGTRSYDGKLQPAKRGVGLLACKAGVPVVPCRLFGAFEAMSRKHIVPSAGERITVVFGDPLAPQDFDPGPGRKDRFDAAANHIMQAIAALELPGRRRTLVSQEPVGLARRLLKE